MRLIKTLILCCFCINSFAQQATITGPVLVEPGAVEYYEVNFPYGLNPYTLIYWNVTGGTITSMSTNPTTSPIYVMVQWDNANVVGSIDIYEDIGGQSGGAAVQVGSPSISPASQFINYATTPQYLCVNIAASLQNVTYQWESSPDNFSWTPISSATDQCYLPPSPELIAYYRCISTINGNQYFSEPASIQINPLSAGIITLAQQPTYNSALNISSTNANGGFCLSANYQYAWEISIEGGPWTIIGTSASFPLNAPSIVGNTLVRRKITCGSQSLYSNTLDIKLNYTSVDYENRNYIRTYTVATKGIHSWIQADQLEVGKKFQETNYFDGLSRSIQVVNKGVSLTPANTWVDMVSFKVYDNLGRATLNYLPFPTANEPGKFKTSTNDQVSFYTANYNESSPWNKNELESSPLNRIKKSIDVGNHRITNNIGLEFDYDFNNSGGVDEKVHIWRIGYAAGDLPTTSSTDVYQNGSMPKFTYINDEGKKVIEYKDLLGNIVLKKVQIRDDAGNEHDGWLCTYYVYDGFNRLRFTIAPKAVAYLDTHNWTLTQEIADELCFYYEYDAKGRVITEKKPGATKLTTVYDQRSRVAFTQDGNQAAKSPQEWLVNMYDDLDRTVVSGIYKSNKPASQLQTEIENAGQASTISIVGPGTEYLDVPLRVTNDPPAEYMATKSVTLLPGFVSNPGDEFVVKIGPVNGMAQLVTVVNSAIPVADYNNPAVFTALMYNYYDNYNFQDVKPFNNDYINLQAYAANEPNIEAISTTSRVINCLTGSKVRVLGSGTFLNTTIYYDEGGRVIQSLSDNYKNGVDVVTNQYHFDGRVMSVSAKHGNPGNNFDAFKILTKSVYDKIGRLQTLLKKYGSADFKKISAYQYDELGHLKNRKIGNKPNTVDEPLETIDYSYNVNGVLTGINKDYALSGNNGDQWNRYFGLYLGYENLDNKFSDGRYDKLITGQIWKSQGDNTPRMYDYVYDNVGRLTAANFKQKAKPSETTWTNAKADFSESDILYDENGNIRQLFRKGVQPANSSPVYIDKLSYAFKQVSGEEWSNQLVRVFDNNPDIGPAGNGKLGDFKDEVYNVNVDDYMYDANGNMVIDNNKKIRNGGANGIIYNYLDKPEKIILENKSTVEYTYDALGNKLAKKVTPVSGVAKTTYYADDFIYEDNTLQFIMHEEGRLRIMSPASSTSPLGASGIVVNGNIQLISDKWGVFEYFIKDHLGSTRLVLTEEYHKEVYKSTMEEAAATEEERIFGKVDVNGNPDAANEVAQTRWNNDNGTVWGTNTTPRISKLVTIGATTTRSIGPNMLLKVMSGDYITSTANYYYDVPAGNVNNNNILSALVSSLLGGLSAGSVSPVIKEGAASFQTILGNTSNSPLLSFLGDRPASAANRPKAYLNYVFFDENLNVIQGAGGADLVKAYDNDGMVSATQIRVPQNGYAYVYLSNESDWPVYFDEFFVAHDRGAIIEESHYYPFGLKIAGISAKAFNKMPNRYGFQGTFSELDEESGYNEFDLRMYDPQIARWIQVDPYDEFANPYTGMGNNPVNNVDVDGGGIFDGVGIYGFMAGAAIGSISAAAVAANNGASNKEAFAAGAAGFLGGGLVGWGVSQVPWGQLFNNKTINFFVTGAKDTKNFLKEAPPADLLFAKIKAAFSFGKLVVIQADDLLNAANQIDNKLKGTGKSIGSLILDSHGKKDLARVEVGTTILEGNKDIVADNQDAFDLLSKYTNVKTKVLLGSCWAGGCTNDGANLANKLSSGLNGATVYAGASVADSKTLFESGNFSSVSTGRFGYGNNASTQVNTGTWYRASGGTGHYIGGYPRIGNAGRIIEKLKPFLTPVKFRKLEKRMKNLGSEEIRILFPTPPMEDIGPPPESN